MRQKQKYNAEEINAEKSELLACRRAFILLSAGIVLHFVTLLSPGFAGETAGPGESRTEPLLTFALGIGTLALTAIPGGLLLWRIARSDRWLIAAKLLVFTAAANIAVMIVLTVFREPGLLIETTEPLAIRVLLQSTNLLDWLGFWWVAVLIAEFGIASRSATTVSRSEMLGYAILAGLSVNLVYAGWSLPNPPPPGNIPDTMAILLQIVHAILVLIVMYWLFYMTAFVSAMARALAVQCDLMKAEPTRN